MDQYEVYINGDKKGAAYTNTGIGDSNLIVELSNHTCSHKSGDSDNYFDYVTVSSVPGEYYAVIAGVADYPLNHGALSKLYINFKILAYIDI